MLDFLAYEFNQRALFASGLIGFVNGYLGAYVVLRKSALFAGALSHTLFPGIAIGALIAGLNPLSAALGALLTALLIGLGAQAISQHSRIDPNASMAVLFTTAFAIGLMVLDTLSVRVSLEDYLFGYILGISNMDLVFVYVVSMVTLGFLILFQRPLLILHFDPIVARTQGIRVVALERILGVLLILTMMASMQAVGTILALGLLVAPASIMYLFVNSPRALLWGSAFLGSTIAMFSVVLSNGLNVRTGALIVLLLGILFLCAFVLSPRYGIMSKNQNAPNHNE